MPAPITIVIPTLNVAQTIAPSLASLFSGVEEGLVAELIFADGGSSDETREIAVEIGARFISCPKGRGSQLRHACKDIKTDWLFIVHGDTVLSGDWCSVIRRHISKNNKAGFGRLKFDAKGISPSIVAFFGNFRARILGLPYGDQTLLISKQLYTEIGGYKDIPLMEDVEMARALKRRKIQLGFTSITSSQKYLRDGWFTRAFGNIGFLCSYLMGRSAEDISKKY